MILTRSILFASSLATLTSAQRTTEAEEAAVTSATQECVPYTNAQVSALSPGYPPIWQNANLSFPGVSAYDKALYASLLPTIPNIAPHGTATGNFTGVVYDGVTDPECWWSYTLCDTPKMAGLQADVTQCNEPNTWGFTLDDGPNCSHNAYFDYLQTINQKATLFYIGSNVMDWPLEAQRGLSDGHELCAHTWSHPYMTGLSNEAAFAELYYSKKAILDVVGVNVECWRPPFGDVDDRIRYIAAQLGMRTIQWKEDTFDWNYPAIGVSQVEANYQAILTKQANGTYKSYGPIVLSHELDNETMALSMQYLPTIQKAFDAVVPVAVCMNNSNPYGSSAWTYPDFAQYATGTHNLSLAAPVAVAKDITISLSSVGVFAASSTGLGTVKASSTSSAVATGTGSATSASPTKQADNSTATSKTSAGISLTPEVMVAIAGGLLGLVMMF